MEPNKILHADILDIIFDGRNKDYGAYDLRKTYDRRLIKALIGTASVIIILFIGYFVSKANKGETKSAPLGPDVVLDRFIEDRKIDPPPVTIVKPRPIETIKFIVPKIVKDNEVKDEDRPPEVRGLEDTRIGRLSVAGEKYNDAPMPPAGESKGIIEAPKQNTDDASGFIPIEVEADYPGGITAWMHYLNKNLHYPDNAVESSIEGDVIVQFIVDKDGIISDVEAISGPAELKDEAVRVIKKSGRWTPAIQNGRQVKSYKKQPIKFRLDTQ